MTEVTPISKLANCFMEGSCNTRGLKSASKTPVTSRRAQPLRLGAGGTLRRSRWSHIGSSPGRQLFYIMVDLCVCCVYGLDVTMCYYLTKKEHTIICGLVLDGGFNQSSPTRKEEAQYQSRNLKNSRNDKHPNGHRACHIRVCVYIYIYMYTYTPSHTYMHTCMHAYIHAYMHAYIQSKRKREREREIVTGHRIID